MAKSIAAKMYGANIHETF